MRFDPQNPVQQSAPDPQLSPVFLHAPPVDVLHTLGVVAPHTPPLGQAPAPTPQVSRPPQPSGMNPQLSPAHATDCAIGVHWLSPPQTLATPPPPQVAGEMQVPHWTMPPQPSAIGPQASAGQVVIGTQPAIVPPPQTFG